MIDVPPPRKTKDPPKVMIDDVSECFTGGEVAAQLIQHILVGSMLV